VIVWGIAVAGRNKANDSLEVDITYHAESGTADDQDSFEGDGIKDGSAQGEEQQIPQLIIDAAASDGYEVQEDGTVAAGVSLLAKQEQNISLGIEPETTVVYDIAEGFLRVPLLDNVEKNSLSMDAFSGEGLTKRYAGSDGIKTMLGVDVSKFQGTIDWQAVKEAGIEFAILRAGLRGYGSGELVTDTSFAENYRKATEAGLAVGVYFFSAAVNEQEAEEEAEYVLKLLAERPVTMPVVFDTEPINYDDARTDDLTPDELTAITKTFCGKIEEAGLQPMIYANAKRFTTVLHLEELEEYEKWLADYRDKPDYPYQFSMWQFTENGSVPGISGAVDIDLYFY
jgi:GH25 family lysozyme M1 (1,4-beta-N-acetylmuramidase)